MKTKLIIVILLVAAAVGVVRSASTIQKTPVPYKDRLKWYAKEAKNKGQQKVRVPAPLTEYLGGALFCFAKRSWLPTLDNLRNFLETIYKNEPQNGTGPSECRFQTNAVL